MHELVRRCLEAQAEGAVTFEAPLNPGARPLHGSRLLDGPTLRRALAWPSPEATPDLAVIFVDSDGDRARKAEISRSLELRKHSHPPVVVAVCVNEIEAWLIADHACARRVLSIDVAQSAAPETLQPGDAKALLARWTSASPLDAGPAKLAIASGADLMLVGRLCPSFDAFRSDLRAAVVR